MARKHVASWAGALNIHMVYIDVYILYLYRSIRSVYAYKYIYICTSGHGVPIWSCRGSETMLLALEP